MATFHAAELAQLYVFKTSFGQREGREEEKILAYYPPDLGLGHQTRNVGLAEALINFTGQFSDDKPVETVYTKRYRQCFFSPEEDIWAILWVANPYTGTIPVLSGGGWGG